LSFQIRWAKNLSICYTDKHMLNAYFVSNKQLASWFWKKNDSFYHVH
jgi:hypothetical protein